MTFVSAKPAIRRKPVFSNGLDRFFDDFFRHDFPFNAAAPTTTKGRVAVNILETGSNFQLEFFAPAWDKADFQIQVEKDVLTVSAETKKEEASEEKKENGVTYRRREFGRSSFKRSFQLPETVDAENIDATYVNGILTLTLPKVEVDKSELVRTIEIS